MTDHLHPTLEGYQLIGKIFYDEMHRTNILPKTSVVVPFELQDSLTKANFMFTDLDSTIAQYRIKFLKNDWPFVDRRKSLPPNKLFTPKGYIDSLASKVVLDKITWVEAHREAASKYLAEGDLKSFQKHMDILIYQYPIIVEYYDYVANEFLKKEDFETAYKYCVRRDNVKPGAFSSKWIGIIELSRHNTEKAIKYLMHSLELKADDSQVLYNLAGAYVMKKDYESALNYVNKALAVDPQYRQALALKKQLDDALK
jgi:tetratricopeptide (TPR) repeat protein